MFLTVHTSAALAISQLPLANWLIFILAFLSHFVLDAIPHGDQNLLRSTPDKKSRLLKLLAIEAVELILILLTLVLFYTFKNTSPVVISLAVLLAGLPDGLEFLHIASNYKNKLLKKFAAIHYRIHASGGKEINLISGCSLQLIIFTVLLLLALS